LLRLALLMQQPTTPSFSKKKKLSLKHKRKKEKENCGSIKMFTRMIDVHQHFCTEKSFVSAKAES
jgi:hypothetical protein